jgi:AraC-like DNA-binding protein
MKPSSIDRTIKAALLLQSHEKYPSPETLLIAWVAWEQLKNRIIYVGLTKQGWQGQTIDEALREIEFWRSANYKRAFKSVFGSHPEQTKIAGKVWRDIESGLNMRNKFVHGMGQVSPSELSKVTENLFATLEDRSWCEILMVKLPNGTEVNLGDPMKRVTAKAGMQSSQSVTRLRKQLGLVLN